MGKKKKAKNQIKNGTSSSTPSGRKVMLHGGGGGGGGPSRKNVAGKRKKKPTQEKQSTPTSFGSNKSREGGNDANATNQQRRKHRSKTAEKRRRVKARQRKNQQKLQQSVKRGEETGLTPGAYQLWRNAQSNGETNASKRARWMAASPTTRLQWALAVGDKTSTGGNQPRKKRAKRKRTATSPTPPDKGNKSGGEDGRPSSSSTNHGSGGKEVEKNRHGDGDSSSLRRQADPRPTKRARVVGNVSTKETIDDDDDDDDTFLRLPSLLEKDEEDSTRAASNSRSKSSTESSEGSPAIPPWLTSLEAKHRRAPTLALHNEILRFSAFLEESADEKRQREELVGRLRDVVTTLWPESKLCVFGSTVTGLALPDSDVDMCVFDAPCTTSSDGVRQLGGRLEALGGVTNLETITKARVPIVKFRDHATGLNVDICFDQDSGLRTATYAKEQITLRPALRPLMLTIKYFLAQRGLNETYTGGFGSFMTLLLVIAYLQRVKRAFGEHLSNQTNLGALLLGFFQYFGRELNVVAVATSVRGEGSLFAKTSRSDWLDRRRPHLLSVENPDEPDADVGRNSWNVSVVRAAFSHAFHALRDACVTSKTASRKGAAKSLLGVVIRVDETLMSRSGC